MLDRQQLETFAAVMLHKHFKRASIALSVAQSAVSQRIKSLEEAVGAVLLMRQPPVRPTRAGEAILRHIVALRLLEEDTLQRIKPDKFPPAVFAIAVNADSLATWFEPIARKLAKRHIALELVVDDQDHTLNALARGDVMGCISTNSQPLVGFIADSIGGMRYLCVAESGFARERFAEGLTLPRVIETAAILFNQKDAFLESRFGFEVRRYVKHYFPSPIALLGAWMASWLNDARTSLGRPSGTGCMSPSLKPITSRPPSLLRRASNARTSFTLTATVSGSNQLFTSTEYASDRFCNRVVVFSMLGYMRRPRYAD